MYREGVCNLDGVLGFLEKIIVELRCEGLVEGSEMKKKEGCWGILKRRINIAKYGSLEGK